MCETASLIRSCNITLSERKLGGLEPRKAATRSIEVIQATHVNFLFPVTSKGNHHRHAFSLTCVAAKRDLYDSPLECSRMRILDPDSQRVGPQLRMTRAFGPSISEQNGQQTWSSSPYT